GGTRGLWNRARTGARWLWALPVTVAVAVAVAAVMDRCAPRHMGRASENGRRCFRARDPCRTVLRDARRNSSGWARARSWREAPTTGEAESKESATG
ncbi:unnamed protein product, partial [Laminaria digitata]